MKKELIIIPIFVLTIILVMLIPNNDYIKTGKLYVSEIMASNNYTIKDDDGDYSDYIEIYNGYKNSINLSNYHLSDDEYDTKKWTFPDITIKSNEYIIVYASGKNKCDLETRICHTNFKLSKSGEIITLTNSYHMDTLKINISICKYQHQAKKIILKVLIIIKNII